MRDELERIIRSDAHLMRLLHAARGRNLPQWRALPNKATRERKAARAKAHWPQLRVIPWE